MSNPYDHQPAPAPARSGGINGLGLASLIVGIVALAVSWVPFIGLLGVVVGIVGVVLGILGIALQKYRGRRALAIAGTIVSGLAMVLSFILPWFTGAFWLLGVVEDSGVIERLETWTPTPRATDRFTDPAVTAPTGTGPDETPAPTESTPAVPTETITP